MILISHRGNINGKNLELENSASYIKEALNQNYNVEIDVWKIRKELLLGHDSPMHYSNLAFLDNPKFWLHAKNIEALEFLLKNIKYANVFWHQEDDFTLTNRGFIWTFPNKNLTTNSICVLPELGFSGNIQTCKGICSDFISNYRS